eukprot:m.253066 g.253066  ORF g.253066 m.253066 type:complete len:158 (+) comp40364_c2_seq9:16-489(+)
MSFPPLDPSFCIRGLKGKGTSVYFLNLEALKDDFLATGTSLGELELWNVKTRRRIFAISAHDKPLIKISALKSRVLTQASSGEIKIWNVEFLCEKISFKCERVLPTFGFCQFSAVNSQKDMYAYPIGESEIKVRDLQAEEKSFVYPLKYRKVDFVLP